MARQELQNPEWQHQHQETGENDDCSRQSIDAGVAVIVNRRFFEIDIILKIFNSDLQKAGHVSGGGGLGLPCAL